MKKVESSDTVKISIAKKVSIALTPAIVVGISAIIYIQVSQMKEEMLLLAETNNATITTLLEEQIKGAIRLEKQDIIKAAYNKLVSSKNSTIANIVIFNNEGKIIDGYTSTKLLSLNTNKDFNHLISTNKLLIEFQNDFQIVTVPVKSEKDNSQVGTLVIAWSFESMNTHIANKLYYDIGLGAIILSCLILILITILDRIVTRPLAKMIALTHSIAHGEGDLNQQLKIESKDELAVLAVHFNTFIEKVKDIIVQIKSCSNHLSDSAIYTSKTVHENEDVLNKQNREFTQVLTAIDEMTLSIQNVASTANDAAAYADDANKKAQSGSELVIENRKNIQVLAQEIESATKFVEELADDSKNIGGMLEVIRGIAEQTNLLALNAAIEAARAGEQGRGFAVVADEVRTLAGRTETATQDINKLIEGLQSRSSAAVEIMRSSSEKSANSVEKTNTVTSVLQEIIGSIENMSKTNFQIASSSEKQTTVIADVNNNISNITKLIDDTVATAKKSAEAGEGVEELSRELKSGISRFTV